MEYAWVTDGNPGLSYVATLGAGGFGEVHKVRILFLLPLICELRRSPPTPDEHEFFARKLVRTTAMNEQDLLNEIRAVQKLCNKYNRNIVEVIGHGKFKNSPFYAIDMELCEVSLEKYIQTEFNASAPDIVPVSIYRSRYLGRVERIAKWRGIVSIILDILHGLKFIHVHDEVHRDLKPTNSIVRPDSSLTSQFYSPNLMAVGKSPISGLRRQARLQASVVMPVGERTVTTRRRSFGKARGTVVKWTSGASDAFFSK